MTILELLKKSRDRISDSTQWVQSSLAEDVWGECVDPQSSEAVRWSAGGAILSYLDWDSWEVAEAVELLKSELPDDSHGKLEFFNDRTSHENVIDVFDRAIAVAVESFLIETNVSRLVH